MDNYIVKMDIKLRVTIKTQAHSTDEAIENAIDDYEMSTIEDFVSNYDTEVRDYEIDEAGLE